MPCPELEALYAKREAQKKAVDEQIAALRAACPHPSYELVIRVGRGYPRRLWRKCERCDDGLGIASVEEYRARDAEDEARWQESVKPWRREDPNVYIMPRDPLVHPDDRPVGVTFNGQPIDPSVDVRVGQGQPPIAGDAEGE